MVYKQLFKTCAVLIYCVRAGGASYLKLTSNNELNGVKLNGKSVQLGGLTSTGTLVAFDGTTRLINNTNQQQDNLVNPNDLGPAVVCMSQVWFEGSPPAWCAYADFVKAAQCVQPFATTCGTLRVQNDAVYSWSRDGFTLFERTAKGAGSLAFTSTLGLLFLCICETADGIPKWALIDAAGWAAVAGVLQGAHWSAAIIHGIAVAGAFYLRATDGGLVSKGLAPSLAIVIANNIPISKIGASPATMLIVLIGVVLCAATGYRGAVWNLPWVVTFAIGPLIWQSGAFDLREPYVYPCITALLTASFCFLGLSLLETVDGTWWSYMLHGAATSTVNYGDPRSGRVVPGGRGGGKFSTTAFVQ